jgi:hypothetical protein
MNKFPSLVVLMGVQELEDHCKIERHKKVRFKKVH